MSDSGNFDDAEKIQILLKGLLNVPSTSEYSDWYLETKGKYESIVEADSINASAVPSIPTWNDSSLNTNEMNSLYGLSMNDFANSNYSYNLLNKYTGTGYTTTGSIKPGIYPDSDGLLHLFVRLKLERRRIECWICFHKICSKRRRQILSNSFQFNYNQFTDSGADIQPYLYILNGYLIRTNLREQQLQKNGFQCW